MYEYQNKERVCTTRMRQGSGAFENDELDSNCLKKKWIFTRKIKKDGRTWAYFNKEDLKVKDFNRIVFLVSVMRGNAHISWTIYL